MAESVVAAIDRIFTPAVIDRLASIRRPPAPKFDSNGDRFRRRHEVLASTEGPDTDVWPVLRKAWAEYLDEAEACGLLSDPEIVAGLVGDEDDAFRAALAECTAAWYLRRRMRLGVQPKPYGKGVKNIDFRATCDGLDFDVEVKAPHVPIMSRVFGGDDAGALVACIKKAGTQFRKRRKNLLIVVPLLRTSISLDREQLLKATIGEWALSVPTSLDPAVEPPPSEMIFLQNGKLARLHTAQDGAATTDHTRVSAVMTIEETMFPADDGSTKLEHRIHVAHNPFAAVPIEPQVFGDVRQLVHGKGVMYWSDERTEGRQE